MPPECLVATKARGRRTPSRLTTPQSAPLSGRGAYSQSEVRQAGIVWGKTYLLVIPAKAGSTATGANERLWNTAFAGMTESGLLRKRQPPLGHVWRTDCCPRAVFAISRGEREQ